MTTDGVGANESLRESPGAEGAEPGAVPVALQDLAILTPMYQSLMARYNSVTAIRWQTLALGLAAQGLVVGAAVQLSGRLVTAIMLAVVILFIGLTAIVVGQRLELVALADRHMLDNYEARFLQASHGDLRLHHAKSTKARGVAMLNGAALSEYLAEMDKGGIYWPVNTLAKLGGPNHWWAFSQATISLAGAAVPLLGYFGW